MQILIFSAVVWLLLASAVYLVWRRVRPTSAYVRSALVSAAFLAPGIIVGGPDGVLPVPVGLGIAYWLWAGLQDQSDVMVFLLLHIVSWGVGAALFAYIGWRSSRRLSGEE
jgi:hypothetical protein